MRVMMAFLLAVLAVTADASVLCGQRFSVGNSFVPYCTNGKSGPAVFVIHGVNRNADDYLDTLDDLGTRVIAPEFQAAGPGLWWDSGWRKGDRSRDATRTSSFAVVDLMAEAMGATHIIGHSAGGQFVTRYAAGTRRPGWVRFIVANPSSYLWLDASRPRQTANCHGFNEYHYGLDDLNAYMSVGVAPDYPDRDVVYLLGSADTRIDSNLDTSCEANAQGRNRYERGQNFYAHLGRYFGRAVHRKVIVHGVGHSYTRMIRAARPYLPR